MEEAVPQALFRLGADSYEAEARLWQARVGASAGEILRDDAVGGGLVGGGMLGVGTMGGGMLGVGAGGAMGTGGVVGGGVVMGGGGGSGLGYLGCISSGWLALFLMAHNKR